MPTRITHWVKLGAAIRTARFNRGWTQHELARRADVSRSWLAKVEAGHRGAELEPLLRVFAVLDLMWTLDDPGAAAERPVPAPAPPSVAPAADAARDAMSRRAAAAEDRRAAWASAGGHTAASAPGARPRRPSTAR